MNVYTGLGQLLENQTIFDKVNRVKPSSIIEIDCNSLSTTYNRYWSWRKIIRSSKFSFEEATDILHELFVQSVKRCLSKANSGKLAITLSGGLDSRVSTCRSCFTI
ncbi:hypothetical protein TUM17384_14550 [Shewanella algae]|nr:hypothetical protein TUM17384_14550 [Shewanella algae]